MKAVSSVKTLVALQSHVEGVEPQESGSTWVSLPRISHPGQHTASFHGGVSVCGCGQAAS